MFLRNLKYGQKVQVLFVPVFALIAAGLVMVYDIAAQGLAAEHAERLRRTAQLTESGLITTEQEMVKLVNLFQTNRTLQEYLYIVSELGGDRQALRDLLTPLAHSLDIEDVVVYDARGYRLLEILSRGGDDARSEQLVRMTGTVPRKVVSGFVETNGRIKVAAIAPLNTAGRILGYLCVGKYLTPAYLEELKHKSGNELLLLRDGAVLVSTVPGWTPASVYTLTEGRLHHGEHSYTVHERPISGLDQGPVATMAVALSTGELDDARSRLRTLMFSMLAIAALLSYGLSRLFVMTLVRPMNEIVAFTEKVARGELEERLDLEGKDEFAQLGVHLNEMRRMLQADRDLVRRYTTDLERLVDERTAALRTVETQLLHAHKMEAVGQMAGGIAHDFNNILTTIMGYASMLQNKIGAADPRSRYVEQVVGAARRAANLTHGLLAFSRRQVLQQRPVDLNEIIRGVEKLLERLIGEDIELITHMAGRPLTIMGDQGQIEQVLMNLAANARDAMQTGGRLELRTDVVRYDDRCITGQAPRDFGEYAMVSVTDSGAGIDPSIREKIFEPFFTTKGVGKGTGLGLAMVYGIVQQHEGCITVGSEVGRGTTFSLYFPMVPVPAAAEPQIVTEAAVPQGSETILVGDDDANVRELLRTALSDAGYRVITAENGEDVVAQYKRHAGRIDLLLLDVIMPKLNGKDALESIRSSNPKQPAIFMSGYADDILRKKGIGQNGAVILMKPLQLNDLLHAVRHELDGSAG